MNAPAERGRITARVSSQIAEKLQEAADLTGATLNQFLVQAALEKAHIVIEREQVIRYTREDAAMLIGLIDAPPRANAALSKAFKKFKSKVDDGSLSLPVGSSDA
jgi:uncharacterized protein (DUF1778 family)